MIDWRVLIARGFTNVYNLHDAAAALREISKVMRDVKAQHGLDVVVRDGDAIDEREKAFYEARERRPAG